MSRKLNKASSKQRSSLSQIEGLTLKEILQLAIRHQQAGHFTEAEALYRKVLQKNPQHPHALHFLGLLARHKRQLEKAVRFIRKALTIKPDYAEAYNNLGTVLQEKEQWSEAMAAYQKALVLKPGYTDAQRNLEALLSRDKVPLTVDSKANIYHNLGQHLQSQSRWKEASSAYRQALAIKPDSVSTYNNLGTVLKAQGQYREAGEVYHRALTLNPDIPEIHYNLGILLQEQGKLDRAAEAYRRALALKPDNGEALIALISQLQNMCDWSQLEALFQQLKLSIHSTAASTIPPFTLRTLPFTAEEQMLCARQWAQVRLSGAIALRSELKFYFERISREKLRIGYVSADFRQHPTSVLIPELIELHDRSKFEIFGYSLGPDDGSRIRRRLVKAFDHFLDIQTVSFKEAACRIYRDRIDILVDLMGYTKNCRSEIFALRPAPIQVNYLGYTATMGVDLIDYLITDSFVTPLDQQSYFTEHFVYMPHCFMVNDRQRMMAEKIPTREECGLPERAFVFCCFNNVNKIFPAMFDVWMRLLQAIPGSVLWLLKSNAMAGPNLRREAQRHGVDSSRLIFMSPRPLPDYLAAYRNADLFLDTLPCNGHTTTSDALWAGLPVLTCSAETFASRVAGSLLKALDFPELMTTSLQEYEARALALAQHPEWLGNIRKKLWENCSVSPAFDSVRFTRHLEDAYRTMWECFVAGEQPQLITISPK